MPTPRYFVLSRASTPRPGRNLDDLEFRFQRAGGLTLAVDFDHLGGDKRPWITVYLWDRRKNAKPAQLAWAHARLADCYLRARSDDLEPSLCFTSNAFALRDAEYEALRAHLLPKGLVHHVPESAAPKVAPPPPAQEGPQSKEGTPSSQVGLGAAWKNLGKRR